MATGVSAVPAVAPVLVLNSGSSSVKLAVLDPVSGERRVTALAERVGTGEATVRVRRGEQEQAGAPADGSHRGVIKELLAALADELATVAGVGHRVVHGGQRFSSSAVVDDPVLATLRELTGLAPLHLPGNLAGIEAARAELPDRVHVAVFDTAFHSGMPARAYRYAVPAGWYSQHAVRRYGFHGTSHRYVSGRAAELLGRPLASLRMVTVHLGNGCSATAVRDGISVDTTMGMTPLEGLVMGTRSGDVDPGALGYLADRLGKGLAGLLDQLNTRSGLLGLSGISNDMREVQDAAEHGSADAALAVEVFCYRVAKAIGALAVALGRLDAVVFTGGIGEHSATVRSAVLVQLGILGITEDVGANGEDGRRTGGRISGAGSVPVLVVPTDEELLIARDTWELTAEPAR
ncbi:acetate/propionate family kinase [Jatrophihabitans sp.]|uniref:acetate/propionate family kinase n=1 Tax=Jatrophihabitans sp. TaxID=1932789 RepID=UPI002C5C75C2|nr:acetate kinase [Jatrophihabitans sp.]